MISEVSVAAVRRDRFPIVQLRKERSIYDFMRLLSNVEYKRLKVFGKISEWLGMLK